MRAGLYFFLSASVALIMALLGILHWPESKPLVLTLLGAFLLLPLWLGLLRKSWAWLARQDLFSPLIAFPIAYVVWFAVGAVDFFEIPSSISFGAFDPIPSRLLFYAGVGLAGYICGARSSLSASRKWSNNNAGLFSFGWEPKMFQLAFCALTLVA